MIVCIKTKINKLNKNTNLTPSNIAQLGSLEYSRDKLWSLMTILERKDIEQTKEQIAEQLLDQQLHDKYQQLLYKYCN